MKVLETAMTEGHSPVKSFHDKSMPYGHEACVWLETVLLSLLLTSRFLLETVAVFVKGLLEHN
jgi:hypothetical protein